MSAMESECVACLTAMRALVFVRALLDHVSDNFSLTCGDKISVISAVFKDDRAAKILATVDPPRLAPHSESLAIHCHWFRSHLGVKDRKGIRVVDVQSSLNKADCLTEGLPKEGFRADRPAVQGW